MRVNIVIGNEDKQWILWDMARYIKDYNSDMDIEISVEPIDGCDIYHVNNDEMFDRPNIPWHRALYTCHQFEQNNHRRTFWAREQAIKAARKIGCVCMDYVNMLTDLGVPKEKVCYTPGGVDIDKFNINDRTWTFGDKISIGYVGRKYESGRKGEDLFREILMLLPRDRVKIIFLGDRREEEVEFCQQLNIEHEYYHRGNNVEYEDYPGIYDKMDCMLITSKEEGGPICAIEALACGIPIITTPVGVTKDIIVKDNGYFYNTANDAVDILSRLINDWDNQANNGNDWLQDKESIRQSIMGLPYTWEHWAQIHREIYEQMYAEMDGKILIEDYMEPRQMEQINHRYSEMAKQQIDPNHLENFLMIEDDARRGQGILGTRGVFKDKPAIVVGAGPSLDKHLDLLKEYQDNFVIISCDAAFPILYENGIHPDVIFVADWTAKQKYNFREGGNKSGKHIDLTDYNIVIPSIVHKEVVDEVNRSPKHHTFWYNVYDPGSKLMTLIPNKIGKKGALVAGVLTTGMLYQFALGMGCEPIVFIGHDLCYHMEDNKIKGYSKYVSEDKRKYQERSKLKADMMLFPDINENMVLSHITFVSFHNWIKNFLKSRDINIINASECGILHGENIEQMRFFEVCERFGEENIALEKKDKLNAAWYYNTVEEII